MEKAVIRKENEVIIRNAEIASRFWERFRGLMFAQSIPDSYGLVIEPCNQIHMLNMKFPLDVIYLSEDGTVVNIDENIHPWAVGRKIKNAVSVIEINSGTCARCGIALNDKLTIEKTGQSGG